MGKLLGGGMLDVAEAAKGRPGAAPPLPLVLNADPLSVRVALGKLIAALEPLELEQEELWSVELVLAEALNNIVEHAYDGQGDGEISVDWSHGGSGLHVCLRDSGRAMPGDRLPLERADPVEHALLVPEGGFGWFLIGGLARNVVYRREKGRNILSYRMAVGLARS